MAAWIALIVLVVSGFVLVGRHDAVVIGGMNAADLAMTASGALLIVCILAAFLPQLREGRPRIYRLVFRIGGTVLVAGLGLWLRGPLLEAGQTAMAWGSRGALSGGSLALPQPIRETLAKLQAATPRDASQSGEKAVRIRSRTDGHFYASAALNGTPAILLVDSGATTVLLKASDARDAGVDTAELSFTTPVHTARGTMYAAPVRLRQLRIGGIVLDDLEALVAEPGRLETSLLGMNFLNRLRSYEFSGAFLTLRG